MTSFSPHTLQEREKGQAAGLGGVCEAAHKAEGWEEPLANSLGVGTEPSFMDQTHIEVARERGRRPLCICGRAAIRLRTWRLWVRGCVMVVWHSKASCRRGFAATRCNCLPLGGWGSACVPWVAGRLCQLLSSPPCRCACRAGDRSLRSTQEALTSASPQE